MESPNSSGPPRPKHNPVPRELRDTWRPSSAPPRAAPLGADASTDQRATPRTRLRHDVQFSVGEGPQFAGVCRNLSLGGAAIQTAEPAAFGARITVLMELEGIDGPTRLGGIVRWTKPGVMGVQWDSVGVRVTHAILRTAAKTD